jgi:nucleoside-diphosphate-sugar epimerase
MPVQTKESGGIVRPRGRHRRAPRRPPPVPIVRMMAAMLLLLLSPPSASRLPQHGVVNGLSVVTGANGYLGQWISHTLLSSSSPSDNDTCLLLVRPERVEALREYWQGQRGNKNAIVLPYDMSDGGKSLKKAFAAYYPKKDIAGHNNGAATTLVVYHVASVFGPTNDHVATAQANVQGTADLVETLADVLGCQVDDGENDDRRASPPRCRLVLTSSMAAVRGSGQMPTNGRYYTRDDWNTYSQVGVDWGQSYQWSKMESEKVAWELCDMYGIPMTSLCPSFLFGPPTVTTSNSYSLKLVNDWLHRRSPVQSRLFCDVRDAAIAHVRAGTSSSLAVGKRYIISSERRVPATDIGKWLVESTTSRHDAADGGAERPVVLKCDTAFQGGAIPIGEREVEAEEILRNDLGVVLRPLRETITDMADYNYHRAMSSSSSSL